MPEHADPDPDHDKSDESGGVVDGPGEPAEPEGDPKKVGPDGTVYDDDAIEEVRRKMAVDES